MSTLKLLHEAQAREAYRQTVLDALLANYHQVNPKTVVAKQCALAGRVYQHLSRALGERNTWHFKKKIASILKEARVARRVSSYGYVWLKGLVANDPSEDLKIAHKCSLQHQKAMHAYRRRNAKVSS